VSSQLAAPRDLDARATERSEGERSAWWRWSLVAFGCTLAVIIVDATWVALADPSEDARAVAAVFGEVLLLVATFTSGARAAGGLSRFTAEVGLVWPNTSDLVQWVKGVLLQFVALVVFGIGVGLIAPHALKNASNTTGLHHASAFALVMVGIGGVIMAPIVEETLFRGFLLQAGTARYGFASAALGTSIVFGLLHGWQVHYVGGATVLVLRLALFGIIQCFLARPAGRLGANVLVHATANFVAAALAARS
jgi:membrane protease YdiL (CAAX protease family)